MASNIYVYRTFPTSNSERLPGKPHEQYDKCLSLSSHAQPHFDDLKERTIEAYLCHDFGGRDFYDAEMRLLICAFFRPQADFKDYEKPFEALIEANGKSHGIAPPPVAANEESSGRDTPNTPMHNLQLKLEKQRSMRRSLGGTRVAPPQATLKRSPPAQKKKPAARKRDMPLAETDDQGWIQARRGASTTKPKPAARKPSARKPAAKKGKLSAVVRAKRGVTYYK